MKHSFFRLRFWHRWLGLAAILPLFIASLSGVLLVYKKPLIRLLVADGASLSIEYSQQQVATQLDAVALLAKQQRAVRVKAPNRQEPFWTLTREDGHHTLYTLDTLQRYRSNLWLLDTFSFIHHLHTKLLLDSRGQIVLLVSSGISLFMLITGFFLWWPGRKGFRWRFIKPCSFSPKTALQLHRHSGIVASPILAIVLISGGIMLWQKQVFRLLQPLPVQTVLTGVEGLAKTEMTASSALGLAQAHLGDGELTYIRFPEGERGHYRFRFRLPGEWHPNGRTSVNVTPATQEVVATVRSDEVSWQYRLINQLYPLHSGYGINGPYQLLVLLGGWFLVWLCVWGMLSYFRRITRI